MDIKDLPTHVEGYSQREIDNAASLLVSVCNGAAETSGWWLDAETGEDVREWPNKFFILWVATKLALIHSEVLARG